MSHQRHTFENALRRSLYAIQTEDEELLARYPDGDYKVPVVQSAWWSWQVANSPAGETVNPHPPALSIVWYPSPEAAHRSMWEPVAIAEGMSYDELCQCQGGGITADGEEVEVSYEDEITGMKLAGAWGWVELDRHIIHAWADHQADPARVIHMLAHEIGHVTGQPHPDPLQEEMRAEQFGNAARLAYSLLQQRQEARHD
jgi:hypothetical protein